MRLWTFIACVYVLASAVGVLGRMSLYADDDNRQQVLSAGDNVAHHTEQASHDEERKYIIMFKKAQVNAQNYEAMISSLEEQGVTVDDRLPIINGVVARMDESTRRMMETNDNVMIEEDKEVRIPEYNMYY
ncbi:hypothetical protein SYNPS1DRAFT_21928 [Syncephalis pseudoplumigaleata]|uniref:Inhibitor I9 domain-containing protein n=1 Tax=Syncephalis pseudoplumigaleata TaxID=1712513 RepID=A0A4P9Z1G9_9FUNG|nr:hypothetical protein SYNPS1DRAFT_21928 [Syncephalis pseudoplumigaleata]|eukprot:RKP26274.1 hypothetical protein SYNPS1DRAFT_21928 [Syncephalis pseudoplumigaleata]